MKPEARVRKAVDKLLAGYGAAIYRFKPVQSRWGTKSLDYLLCPRGRFFAIETKHRGSHMTAYQCQTARDMTLAGATVFEVATGEGVEMVRSWLDGHV
jgi:hypothetical protein